MAAKKPTLESSAIAPAPVPCFDTHRYMETLKHKGGIPERQAVAQTEALQESLHQSLQGLATKSDIRDLKADIRVLEARMDALQEQMSGLRHMIVLGMSINGGMILMLGLFIKFF